jgi:GDP-4-dehydro-6-deoxy-D-mannose reductase
LTKVLITGVTAFVGSHLADYLLDKVGDIEVHGIRRPRSRDEFTRKEVIYHEADITDYTGISEIVAELKPDFIFHLAAQSFVPLSWQAPQATLITNILGTLNILEAIRKYSPSTTMQFAGSSEEYGMVYEDETPIKETNPLRPMSPYGVSKVAADLLCQQYLRSYGTKVVITRAFNHTGPRRGEIFVTSQIAKQIVEAELGREPIIYLGNLDAQRDFTDVRDMVRAYWQAVHECSYGKPYNICSGRIYPIRKVLKILLKFSKVDIEVKQDPARMRPSDVPILLGDSSRFESETGWHPEIPFEKTMEDLLNYWREKLGRR